MAERLTLTKPERINLINGGAERPSVVVSFAPADVPSLSPQASEARMKAAKDLGVNAMIGRLGTVRAFQAQAPDVVRILLATNAPNKDLPDVLEQEVSVLRALGPDVNAHAIGVGYHPQSSVAADQRKIFQRIEDEAQLQGGELPVFSFISPSPSAEAEVRAELVRDAAQRGADAVVIDSAKPDTAELVSAAADLGVPVYIKVDCPDKSILSAKSVLLNAAQARDAGAAGIVLGMLPQHEDTGRSTTEYMIAGLSEVVREGKAPENAYLTMTGARW